MKNEKFSHGFSTKTNANFKQVQTLNKCKFQQLLSLYTALHL